MKKIVLTTLAVGCLAFSAFAQGSLVLSTGTLLNGVNVTTYDLAGPATSVDTATTWFTGTASYQLWYKASVPQAQLDAINAYNNVANGSISAMALLASDGFTLAVSGAGTGNDGTYAADGSGGTVNLPSPIPPLTAAYLALVLTDTTSPSDGMTGWRGVLAFANNTGGNYTTTPAGLPGNLTGWDALTVNLVMSPVPEPGTMALAGLGGLSLLLFRRRK
jgi:hypothetical protein